MVQTESDTNMTGLAQIRAAELLQEHGANQIQKEKAHSAWYLLADQFKSPLVIILIFACIVSTVLGASMEAIAIGAILFLNALIGFFQEYRAETAIIALAQMTSPKARVFRDGHQIVILAQEVVPGDILSLESGDIIAADAQVLKAAHFQVNEAVLTGESLPARKAVTSIGKNNSTERREDLVFMGTSVLTGTASAKVTATGMKTELGKIAHLITTATSEPTPLQIQLARVGKSLLYVCLFVVTLVAGIGFFQGRPWLELLLFSVSLAVAVVPEGMPAIVTVALALGVQRVAKRNALIRKLPSVETLGSVSVICTDKTGTLTTGNMRVRELWGNDHQEILKAAAACCDSELNSNADGGTGDPTEIAILIAAHEKDISRSAIEKNNPRTSTVPFDTETRRMSVTRADGKTFFKGAMESILSLCNRSEEISETATKAGSEMSGRGLRVLAVAIGEDGKLTDLKFLGLIGLADPPRPEAMQAIKEARSAGIRTVMITGDHPETAAAIARELGLVIEGESLETRVHARATPEDKLNLVRSWKSKGAIVAMTGDGVNDAPALREAHIGIAMGKAGTEVTRQAADLVLADDNFATIVAAVSEGRGIFLNIRKAITYLLAGNFSEVTLVLGAITFGLPLPLLAAHLLWINLVTDALPALTLVAEPLPSGIMSRPPRASDEQIMGRPEWTQVIWIGLLEASVALTLYWYLIGKHDLVYSRNIVFSTFVISQILRTFGARSTTLLHWEVGPFSNLWLIGVCVGTGVLQLSLHFIPFSQKIFGLSSLSSSDLLIIIPVALISISVIELKKIIQRVRTKGVT